LRDSSYGSRCSAQTVPGRGRRFPPPRQSLPQGSLQSARSHRSLEVLPRFHRPSMERGDFSAFCFRVPAFSATLLRAVSSSKNVLFRPGESVSIYVSCSLYKTFSWEGSVRSKEYVTKRLDIYPQNFSSIFIRFRLT